MNGHTISNASANTFREVLPDLKRGMFVALPEHDAHTWVREICKNPFAKTFIENWQALWAEPFVGVTTNGIIIPNLYKHEDYGIDVDKIISAIETLLQKCDSKLLNDLQFPVNARQWRSWSNPEIYVSKYGLRLEEVSESIAQNILDVLRATLSPEGYEKAEHAMLVNEFLGQLVKGEKVLNRRSYNFLLFGQPSHEQPWGWSIYGHHFCMNVFLYNGYISISPVFIGTEPNEIDQGPNKGITMMRREEQLGLQLVQNLTKSQRDTALIYPLMHDPRMPAGRWNEADQRHLCGAFQDNREVPYEGVCVSDLGQNNIDVLFDLIEEFVVYLPQPARSHRLNEIRRHLNDTFFCWIGSYGKDDPFYYRIQSPVLVLEFDHHSGVFLGNKEPAKYHIHTIARMPNGGDYGNAVRSLEHKLQ